MIYHVEDSVYCCMKNGMEQVGIEGFPDYISKRWLIPTLVSLFWHWLTSPNHGTVVCPTKGNDRHSNKENTVHHLTPSIDKKSMSHYTVFCSRSVSFHVYWLGKIWPFFKMSEAIISNVQGPRKAPYSCEQYVKSSSNYSLSECLVFSFK